MKVDHDAVRVYLEDHGQDLLRFTLRNWVIEDANAQGFVWNGKAVINRNIKPGDIIKFVQGGELRYPVATLLPVTEGEGEE